MIDYALMNQCLYEGKAKEVEQMTRDALAEGRSVQEVLNDGLIAGMSVVGEDFKHNVLYVPEVLIAARAMKAGMSVLKPLLSAKVAATKGIVIHTITFSNDADIKRMTDVAAATGGQHFHAPDAAALLKIFKEIAATLPVLLTD